MLLSKSCIYGIQATLYLAIQQDRPYIPIKEISEKMNISFHFLTKILQILTHAGIVKSEKGPKGGVALLKAADKISIFDIVHAIDGDAIFEECVMGFPGCSDDFPCSLHKIWKITKHELKIELQKASLQFVAGEIIIGNIQLSGINIKNIPKFKTV